MKFNEMEKWQKKRLIGLFSLVVVIGTLFLAYTSYTLFKDKLGERFYWDKALSTSAETVDKVDLYSENATEVMVGTYIENLKEISLKSSYYRVVFLTWFRWEGDEELDMVNNFRVYKGYVNKKEVVKDYHENGVNYQLVRCDVTVTKNFWTKRFPLESHQLKLYLEADYPVDKVVFKADAENSGYNEGLDIAGYTLHRYDNGVIFREYDNTHSDPELIAAEDTEVITSEFVTLMEINRSSWGLYLKCFIALVGTTTWVLITLYINTYHRVDPLSMIPAALFGTVSNIMVGANLLPDALQTGLLEYVNMWGIFTILAVAITIININRVRVKFEDRDFAGKLGRIMFYTILLFVLVGHILLPVSAYIFN